MIYYPQPLEFEWDIFNKFKNAHKHKITNEETESVFVDSDKIHFSNTVNDEKRHIVIGCSQEHNILFVVFTIRKEKIRIVSSRKASKKERGLYETKIKKRYH